MSIHASKTPRSNALRFVDFEQLERVPAYWRKRVEIAEVGKVITATRPTRTPTFIG
ncbi:hypothetical protein QN383_18945 [Pseudomonas sp. AA4]|uniref:hypothetical protein n=1 Tax=unclassified Pseudomonas TaxID=196821 RepID=UPI002B23BE47|nr:MULTISPECIES: hypothetical protein [unclassified Pseudomonas]MEA9996514.1 hypothetical protein [Pseudomonas sp. AA4]MEB0222153.1 hypothetical protein [Pseudomonas sp. AB12(2023)]